MNKEYFDKFFKHPENTVILDTETTGLDNNAQIIEIAIIDANSKVLLDQLVKPTVSIPAETSKIHGLYDKDVKHAPSFAQIAKQVQRIIKGKKLVIWNAPYDMRLIEQSTVIHGIDCTLEPELIYCAQTGYTIFNGQKLSLVKAAAKHGIDHSNAHRALADVKTTLKILKVMATTIGVAHG